MIDALRMSLNATAVFGFVMYILVAAILFALLHAPASGFQRHADWLSNLCRGAVSDQSRQ